MSGSVYLYSGFVFNHGVMVSAQSANIKDQTQVCRICMLYMYTGNSHAVLYRVPDGAVLWLLQVYIVAGGETEGWGRRRGWSWMPALNRCMPKAVQQLQ